MLASAATFALLLQIPLVWQHLPGGATVNWFRGGAVIWAMIVVGTALVLYALRIVPHHNEIADPGRRKLLQAARAAMIAAPALATGFGVFVQR